MYYPIAKFSAGRSYPWAAVFIFVISQFALPANTGAGALTPQAQEYRDHGYGEQQKGRFKSALNYYLKALSLGIENAGLLNDIGVVYEHLESLDHAETYYLKAIQTDKDYLPSYTNLASLYQSAGYPDKAIPYLQERLRRAPADDPWKEKIRNKLYDLDPRIKGQLVEIELEGIAREKAEDILRKTREEFNLEVLRAEKHYQRGRQLLDDRRFDEAIVEFDHALTVTPGNPKITKAREKAEYEKTMEGIKARMDEAARQLDAGELDAAKKEFQHILATIPKESVQNSEE